MMHAADYRLLFVGLLAHAWGMFDKTGTITKGKPEPTDVPPSEALPKRRCCALRQLRTGGASTRWPRPS